MEKPTFNADQIVSSSVASKHFGTIRKKAKIMPQFITDNGTVDAVVLDYNYYEQLYMRLKELEEIEEARVLKERIDRLEANPDSAVSWRKVRRSGINGTSTL
jgi:PHD/YefM family antitoxin component YafN of YafNO toxin-antitoxin module